MQPFFSHHLPSSPTASSHTLNSPPSLSDSQKRPDFPRFLRNGSQSFCRARQVIHLHNLCYLLESAESAMVSIRRRRLLGLCSGKSSFLVPRPRSCDNGSVSENHSQNVKCSKSLSVHPILSIDFSQQKQMNVSEACPGSTNISSSSLLKEEQNQQLSGQEAKHRRRRRRKHFEDQEPCAMRGVYFKNMKWQAAIKVDKKQIHLGTVGSQEEAAHLYDRAAYLCGREPNFELPEEEKQELLKFRWEEFLAMTRNAITSKKHQRRLGAGTRKKPGTVSQSSDLGGDRAVSDYSASEEVEADTSNS